MGFVMYLIYAELYQIGQVCEYCTGVHIVTFLLFCITVCQRRHLGTRQAGKSRLLTSRLPCGRCRVTWMTLCSCSRRYPGLAIC